MRDSTRNASVEFFEAQFQRQIRERDYALNPFETLALEHLHGSVLDLGAGLGNLSLEAARRGHEVVAVEASPVAIARIEADARREQLALRAVRADLAGWSPDEFHDTIVAIGLLMFFPRERAFELLREIVAHVRPGGRAIINVLVEGTTFLGMFDGQNYHLFSPRELEQEFAGWQILAREEETFPAPGETRKQFVTLIAAKPAHSS